jgi:hypothetical protein
VWSPMESPEFIAMAATTACVPISFRVYFVHRSTGLQVEVARKGRSFKCRSVVPLLALSPSAR